VLWGWDTGRTDWNPHFFFYPSLSLYLHFFLQKVSAAAGMLTGATRIPPTTVSRSRRIRPP
jgi:hypothetical protein